MVGWRITTASRIRLTQPLGRFLLFPSSAPLEGELQIEPGLDVDWGGSALIAGVTRKVRRE